MVKKICLHFDTHTCQHCNINQSDGDHQSSEDISRNDRKTEHNKHDRMGYMGVTGPMGPAGPRGQHGKRGKRGKKGKRGPIGLQGPIGAIDPQEKIIPVGTSTFAYVFTGGTGDTVIVENDQDIIFDTASILQNITLTDGVIKLVNAGIYSVVFIVIPNVSEGVDARFAIALDDIVYNDSIYTYSFRNQQCTGTAIISVDANTNLTIRNISGDNASLLYQGDGTNSVRASVLITLLQPLR